MRHVKNISTMRGVPGTAMSTSQIILLVGTILSGVGGMLMGVSQIIGNKV